MLRVPPAALKISRFPVGQASSKGVIFYYKSMGFQIHTPKIHGTTVLAPMRDVLPVCRATANLEQRPHKLVENAVKLQKLLSSFPGCSAPHVAKRRRRRAP